MCEKAIRTAALEIDHGAMVSGRVKSHRSVLGKIYRRSTPRPWDSLGDLIALKAIFPTERGVSAFTDWVLAQVDWHPALEVKKSGPAELSYQSMQFDLWCDQLVDSQGTPIKVELQVRTAVADAWYVVDHRLRYKGAVPLPSEVERKLYRLIVLTELFDQEVEPVIASQASLPEYGVARLYESLTREIDKITNGFAKTSRPEGLLELLLTAYSDQELEQIEEVVATFLEGNRSRIAALVKAHLHGSAEFVESRDWLYYEPETLLVAERAATKPRLLEGRIQGSDFEGVLAPMVAAFRTLT